MTGEGGKSGSGGGVDPALEELRRSYQEGDLVLFAGAGVSAAAGLPSWGRLVELLVARAEGRGASAKDVKEIGKLLKAGRFIDALSLAKTAVGDIDFGEAVEHALDDQRVLEVPEVAQAIAALAPRLRAVLTTNVDHLLERAFAARWPALYRATADMAQRRRVILKLHGTLFDRSTWVFTRDQYDRAMYNDPLLSQAFSAIFFGHPILFVGYGLADDDFDQILARVRAISNAQAPRHFALVPRASITPHWRTVREKAGLRIIGYPTPGGSHAEVPRILRWLVTGDEATALRGAQTAPAVAAFRSTPALDPPPPPSAGPPPPPPGAPYDPRWYMHRPAQERQALEQLETPGTPVTIWGPERFGKSLLLRYLLEQVRDTDTRKGRRSLIVEMNLRLLLPEPFSFDALCQNLAAHLVKKTGGDDAWVSELAKSPHAWPAKLVALMEDRILPAVKGRLVLAVDEADALWRDPKQHGLYRIFRSFCDKANEDGWSKLRFIFLLSTASSLAFEGPNHKDSPFNLGSAIDLPDLGVDQIVAFARKNGLTWSRADVEQTLQPLVGGHPYLLHVLMYAARLSGAPIEALAGDPDELHRLFGNQLSELARLLELEPRVEKAMRSVLESPEVPLDEDLFLRLRRAGLVTRAGGKCAIRYGLYRDHLRRRWPAKKA